MRAHSCLWCWGYSSQACPLQLPPCSRCMQPAVRACHLSCTQWGWALQQIPSSKPPSCLPACYHLQHCIGTWQQHWRLQALGAATRRSSIATCPWHSHPVPCYYSRWACNWQLHPRLRGECSQMPSGGSRWMVGTRQQHSQWMGMGSQQGALAVTAKRKCWEQWALARQQQRPCHQYKPSPRRHTHQ